MISEDVLVTGGLAICFGLVIVAYDRIKAWLDKPRIHPAE